MFRGLTHSEAQRMVILGLLHPAVKRIPLRSVRAVLQFLIDEKWAGRGGLIPPRPEAIPKNGGGPEKGAWEEPRFVRGYQYGEGNSVWERCDPSGPAQTCVPG